jgi:DNA polymerase-3 subunit epsilon
MRELILDTETTGFEPSEGHRIVEIGIVEVMNLMPTGRTWHKYFNPQRPMPAEAFAVHGLGDDFLADKPLFPHLAQEFLDFIGDAQLVIHNAAFDMKFLNAELRGAGLPELPFSRAVDTLMIARKKFPGAPASLDALCRRFGIDNSSRTLHGALLDSQILADVYLELLGGQQPDFALAPVSATRGALGASVGGARKRPVALAPRVTQEEADAHAAFVEKLGESAVWRRYQ